MESGDPSVRSLFVTGPVIMLVFSATWKSMKPIAPILIAAFLAAVFALDVVRVFSYSRFPISDYKSFITLGLVVLAAAVFRHLDEVPARVGIRLVLHGVLPFWLFYAVGLIVTRDAAAVPQAMTLAVWSGLIFGTLAACLVALAARPRDLSYQNCVSLAY